MIANVCVQPEPRLRGDRLQRVVGLHSPSRCYSAELLRMTAHVGSGNSFASQIHASSSLRVDSLIAVFAISAKVAGLAFLSVSSRGPFATRSRVSSDGSLCAISIQKRVAALGSDAASAKRVCDAQSESSWRRSTFSLSSTNLVSAT